MLVGLGMPLNAEDEALSRILDRLGELVELGVASDLEPTATRSIPWW